MKNGKLLMIPEPIECGYTSPASDVAAFLKA